TGRMGNPADMGNAVALLCGEQAVSWWSPSAGAGEEFNNPRYPGREIAQHLNTHEPHSLTLPPAGEESPAGHPRVHDPWAIDKRHDESLTAYTEMVRPGW